MIESCDYSPGIRANVLALAGRSEVGERIWEWQFEDNPRGLRFQPVILRESETGDVVGFNGVMPVRVRYRGNEVTGCWSCDFHVRSDMRGQGVGRQVKEALHDRYPLLMTFGVSASAAKVLPRVGWRAGDEVTHLRRLQSPGQRGDWLRIAAQNTNRLLCRLFKRPGKSHGLSTQLTSELPNRETVDQLWHRVSHGYDKIVCRDHVYLDWRYQRCPVGRYRFILVYEDEQLRAIAVYRQEGRLSRLVDLLADQHDEASRGAVLDAWLRASEVADVLSLVTSDTDLRRQAACRGFFRARGSPGFFVRSESGEAGAERGWFVMAGDSDGEFLQAAWDARAHEREPDELRVYQLTPDECFGSPDRWQDLVHRSGVNQLFMGWAWQSSWWQTWHRLLGLEPMFLAVLAGKRLVALAPFYRYHQRIMPGYRTTELHLIGNAPGIAPTVRTEYTDIIVDPAYRAAAAEALAVALRRVRWDILAICDHVTPGYLGDCLSSLPGWRVKRKTDCGVRLRTVGNFRTWLADLSQNTRRQVYNQRRQLRNRGDRVRTRRLTNPETGLNLLNRFHCRRWGSPAFEGASLGFHRRFLSRLPSGSELRFDALEVDGKQVSVLYDVRLDKAVYNIQMGFDQDFDQRLSLGTLHLGYAIQEAFEEASIAAYDFLAGGGKKTQYKKRFKGQEILFESFSIVRRPGLRAIYAIYYNLPPSWQDVMGRWAHRRLGT